MPSNDSPQLQTHRIILVGGTGALGYLICQELRTAGAAVRALVRADSAAAAVSRLREQGAEVVAVDFADAGQLQRAFAGGTCCVSAVSGLRDVIVDLQTQLLKAAVAAGVPRFIPSDFCIDYTKMAPGPNRNLDLRREFNQRLDQAPLAATSILNGMFTDLLTGQAPVVLFGPRRVLYWGRKTQRLDFTTMADTATYTAAAALDSSTPRYLRIAGDVRDAEGLRQAATEATGQPFRFLRPGGLGAFGLMIKITRTLFPQRDEVFPAWQGMQYMYDMFTGRPKLTPLDNDRYPEIQWTSVPEVLATREKE